MWDYNVIQSYSLIKDFLWQYEFFYLPLISEQYMQKKDEQRLPGFIQDNEDTS